MKWILIAAMAEMVGAGISPHKNLYTQMHFLPTTDMSSATMIAQYETREECETYAFNMLLEQSILLRKIEPHSYLSQHPDHFEDLGKDQREEYL